MKALFITTSIIITLAFSILPSRGIGVGIGINTSDLINQGGRFYYLDFILRDGSGIGDANNTVEMDGIYFGGSQPPVFDNYLTDTAVLNTFLQTFRSDTPDIAIALFATSAVDAGGTPDQFIIKILDSGGTPIPTHGPGDAFVVVDLDSANPVFQTFGSDLDRTAINIPAPTVGSEIPIPDSEVPTILVAALWATGLLLHRKKAVA